jgi:hypothetical protein
MVVNTPKQTHLGSMEHTGMNGISPEQEIYLRYRIRATYRDLRAADPATSPLESSNQRLCVGNRQHTKSIARYIAPDNREP